MVILLDRNNVITTDMMPINNIHKSDIFIKNQTNNQIISTNTNFKEVEKITDIS